MQTLERPTQSETLERPFKRLYTLEEFFKMGELGLFKDQRVELVDGEVLIVPPQGFKHSGEIALLNERLRDQFANRAVVWVQLPIILDSVGKIYLEPDLSLLRPPLEQYRERFATPEDAFLVIEVSVSSLEDDRTRKLELYANNGIPEYWIINVEAKQLEVYREPEGKTYRNKQTFNAEHAVAPLEFPDAEIRWW